MSLRIGRLEIDTSNLAGTNLQKAEEKRAEKSGVETCRHDFIVKINEVMSLSDDFMSFHDEIMILGVWAREGCPIGFFRLSSNSASSQALSWRR